MGDTPCISFMSIILARVQFYHFGVEQILAQSLFGLLENSSMITYYIYIYMKTYLCKENLNLTLKLASCSNEKVIF